MSLLPAQYQAELDGGSPGLADLLRITRSDGVTIGLTSASDSETIGGVFYDAAHGLSVSAITTNAGLAVDNLELSSIDDGTIFTRAQVLGGVWQNASFLIGRYLWAHPEYGIEPLLAGTFGRVTLRSGEIVAELLGLQQYLQQEVGNYTSRTCRARFADYPAPNGNNRCRLTAAPFISTRTVHAATDQRTFTVTFGTAVPEDYYGEGLLKWLTGANAGMRMKVKSQSAAGAFALMLPMPSPIAAGDTFEVIAGCRKRLAEDCKVKFNNVLNFQGEPHLPGVDALTAAADASA